MRSDRIVAAVPLTFCMICFGQIKIPIQDISTHRSPVRTSGTVSVTGDASNMAVYTYRVEGSLLNRSHKGVVLTVIHFKTGGGNAPPLDYTVWDDRFFGLATLLPKKSEAIDSAPVNLVRQTQTEGQFRNTRVRTRSPRATAKVEFLQFADGSTWGDADSYAVRDALKSRRETLQVLTKLGPSLDGVSELDLKNQLAEDDIRILPPVACLVSLCKDRAEHCLVGGVHAMIQAAKQHEMEMRNHADSVRP